MRPTLDRATFVRPIAHRGLHDRARGIVENTAAAFRAALADDCAIECDLRPARGGEPMVFHDFELDRLTQGEGPITNYFPSELQRIRYRRMGVDLDAVVGASAGQRAPGPETIITLAELLDLVDGKVPLMVEIKSDWVAQAPEFLDRIAALARSYRGPIAWKAYDPSLMAALRTRVPEIPRGIVARKLWADKWWPGQLHPIRRMCLSHLLCCLPAAPSFISYHVADLPAVAPFIARHGFRLPLFTWAVCSAADRAIAAKWADAPIFEGKKP